MANQVPDKKPDKASKKHENHERQPDEVDEASWESFPASDPPSWHQSTAVEPDHEQKRDAPKRHNNPSGNPAR